MRKLLLFALVLLTGCIIYTAPDNNIEFDLVVEPKELEGVYRNLGERGAGSQESYKVYLSRLIWPTDKNLDHGSIEAVEISAASDSALVVKAMRGGKVVKEATFVAGQDFAIESGRIRLMGDWGFLPRYQVPFLGLFYESADLGLDQAGHGKLRKRFGLVGLLFLWIPIAGGDRDDVRFERMEDTKKPGSE